MKASENLQSGQRAGGAPAWGGVVGRAVGYVTAAMILVTAVSGQSVVVTPAVPITTSPAITLPANGNGPEAASPQNSGGTRATAQAGSANGLGGISNNPVQNQAAGNSQQANPRRVAPEGLSEFQQMVESTTGRTLPIFGQQLFQGAPSTFAPLGQVPVPQSYTIGPGDEIGIQIWGQNTMGGSFTVDRTGSLSLPSVGTVRVAGMTAADLQPYLKSLYDKLYKDVHLSATLGQLRSIQVFVMGYAVSPGTFTIGSLSTLVDALFVSGGPLPNGSMRDIQLKRGAATVVHFDLYDFLLHGDKTNSVPLQDGDTIFIPAVGPQVAVTGSVNTPAIYELKQETTASQALQLAGGETNVAAGTQVRLERIFEHSVRSVEDVSLTAVPAVTVRNGDILSVSSVLDNFRNAVTLTGNVANPARYPWHAGMRVSELIPNKDALLTRNYFERYNRLGQMQGTERAEQGALAVPVIPSTEKTASSSVAAALTENSERFAPENSVILTAPDINWSYAVIERKSSVDLQTSLIAFNLGRLVLDGDQTQNLELQPGDVVRIFSKADIPGPVAQRTRFVQLTGEFVSAGWYSVLPGETLRKLVARVGLTPDAYLYGSEFSRESERKLQQQRLQEIADQLEQQISARLANSASNPSPAAQQATQDSAQEARATVARLRSTLPNGRIAFGLQADSRGIENVPDIALEDGDRFVVPHVPDNVSVQGQVYNASAFIYHPGRHVKDYLHQAGGPNREADRSRVFVLRADGSVTSNQYTNVEKAPIYAGDTVVVPPSVDKRSVFRNIVDFSTVLTGLGVPLTTLYLLARQ